ncbi:MAG TPA: hypothetical protein VKU36_05310 [Candidatus Babeliales bacterium]|nr:hypothetical protein [Candidatus Babeliales bacterium]
MKNTKNIILGAMLVMVVTTKAVSTDPNFEFYNKSNAPAHVFVTVNDAFSIAENVDAGKILRQTVKPNSSITVEITPASGGASQTFELNPADKTAYVSWNPEKKPALYPQTGPLKGIGKMLGMKSNSGLSLKNNLSASQIEQIQ